MKCEHCGYEGSKAAFRYLYTSTLDSSTSWRECPKCYKWVFTNEIEEENPGMELPSEVVASREYLRTN